VLQLHYLQSHQVLDRLRLRTVHVRRNQQQGRVHHRRTSKHSREKDLVAGAVAEGDVALQHQRGLTALVVALRIVLLVTRKRLEAVGSSTLRAFENLGIGIPQPNGDVSHSFLPKPNSGHSRDGPDYSGLAVRDMTHGAHVERGLSAHHLGGVGGEGGNVLVVLGPEFLELRVQLVDLLLRKPRDSVHRCVVVDIYITRYNLTP